MFCRLLVGLAASCIIFTPHRADASFPGTGGDYGGIIEAESEGDPNDSGIVTLQLADSGRFSAKLVWQGQAYAFKGAFTPDGTFTKPDLEKKGAATPGAQLTVSLALTADTRTIDGTLSDPDGGSTPISAAFQLSGQVPDPALSAQLEAGTRMAFIDPPATAADQTSTWNSASRGVGNSTAPADGFSIITIAKTSKVTTRFVGRLPDTEVYSAGSPLRGSQYALRSALYAQKRSVPGGQLLGRANVSSGFSGIAAAADTHQVRDGTASLIASLRWHKRPGLPNTTAFPGGFNEKLDLDTLSYFKDRSLLFVLTGQKVTPISATLQFTGGNLRADLGRDPLSVPLTITPAGISFPDGNSYKLKLRVSPLTAKFSGSFLHPDTGEELKFEGAFRSFFGVSPGQGKGNFLSVPDPAEPSLSQSGSVRISPTQP